LKYVEVGWNKTDNSEKLTAAEIGKLWATYMGNSMGIRILSYFVNNVEDTEIRSVLEKALRLCEQFTQSIHDIFSREHYPIPIGFTEKDVNVDAPRLYEDEFYAYYMLYAGKAGISLYSTAVPLMSRPDIRTFFTSCLNSTVELLNHVINVMATKGFLIKPPYIPEAKNIDFVKKQSYLNGFFGDVRPLQSLEITHLYENVLNNAIGRAISTGFSQAGELEQVRNYFMKVKKLASKHMELFSEKLQKEDLPYHPPLDHLITSSTNSPFSDKLMLFHKIDMLLVRIRIYGNALSFFSRHDLSAALGRCLLEVGDCVEDGANIMIDLGWFEQPPQAIDRDTLARTK
jgi:hypothetical protein